MTGQLTLFGLDFPALLPLALLSLVAAKLGGRAMARFGLYRYVWHPALFDFSLFMIVLGTTYTLFSSYGY